MTRGSVTKALLRFTLPLILTGVLQQMYAIVDALIVGNYAGELALAAVGCTTPLNNIFIFLTTGIVSGLTIQVAYYFGAGDRKAVGRLSITFTSIIIMVACVMAVLGILLSNQILRLLHTDENLFVMAGQYIRIILLGVPFMVMYNLSSAVLRGIGDSRSPLYALLISSVVNIGLDLLFVCVFHWSVVGAAVATATAQALSALFLLWQVKRRMADFGVAFTRENWDMEAFMIALKLSIPKTIQSSMMSVGSLLLQNVLNSFGVAMVTAITAAYKVDMLLFLPVLNGAIAMSIFTGQNLGAGDRKRAREGLWKGVIMMVCFALICSLSMYFFGDELIAFFGVSGEVVDLGYRFLYVCCWFYPVMGFYEALSGYLQGCKHVVFASFTYIGALTLRVSSSYLLAGVIGTDIVAIAEIIGWFFGFFVCGTKCILMHRKQNREEALQVQ